DQHAPAGGAAVRFDHEVGPVAQVVAQMTQHRVVSDLGINLRGRYTDAHTEIAHAQLVIDEGIKGTRIVIEDAGGIAMVHAQDSQSLEPACSSEDPVHRPSPLY